MDSINIFENCIYNNYLCCINKFNDTSHAYEQTKFALKQLLRYSNFNGFTRTSNIRSTLANCFNEPNKALPIFADKFIDIMLKQRYYIRKKINFI